ncbi:GNAT family N-acetyltransferase [Shouchella lehensis]|nr:GNAT family N-acetyltransferase [Shouchella lehensis]
MTEFLIELGDANSKEATYLMRELSERLTCITGDSGEGSFNTNDLNGARAIFAICRYNGEPIGCGALRPITETTAELKRMYSRKNSIGVGSRLLSFLEQEAQKMNFSTIRLETRRVNTKAVQFYEGKGYGRISNYGKYIGRSEAVCFEKVL